MANNTNIPMELEVVELSRLKSWFVTGAKPTQSQFHGLLNSYYHKSSPIPMSGIDGLSIALSKKADLVNGLIPESQLPFTVNSNEVLSIGNISINSGNVTIGVNAEFGINKVRIIGQILTNNFPTTLSFMPVSGGNKFLRIVARNEPGLFFLKEGNEGDDPQEPALAPGELHVRLILLTPEGPVVDPETLNGFKDKAEDNWKKITYISGSIFNIQYTDKRQNFYLTPGSKVLNGTTYLAGIQFVEETTRDLEFLIFNNSISSIEISANLSRRLIKGFSQPFTIKSKEHVLVKYDHSLDCLDVIKLGGNVSDIVIDRTLQGDSTSGFPLGLSAEKNDEIAGKITKPIDIVSLPTLDYFYIPLLSKDGDSVQMDVTAYMNNNYYTKTQIAALGYVTTAAMNTALSNKLDKVSGTGIGLAQINNNGSLSRVSVTTNPISKVIGKDTLGNITENNAKSYSSISILSSIPPYNELEAFGTDEVQAQNLNGFFKKVGLHWHFYQATTVITE